jgi:hypothetical protein
MEIISSRRAASLWPESDGLVERHAKKFVTTRAKVAKV